MIMRIHTEGKPKDKKTEDEVNKYLDGLSTHIEEYIIGIDYASPDSKDYTCVSHFSNKNGVYKLKGIEMIK